MVFHAQDSIHRNPLWLDYIQFSELSMTVVTRFAPSPTGFLHIGSARTALFNWLYARANDGKFLLRVEDTDRKRSTPEAVDAILSGLSWLGVDWDDDPVYQYARADRHREVAESLIELGHAFKCYVPQEELAARKDQGQALLEQAKNASSEGNADQAEKLRREADLLLAPYRSPYRDPNSTPPGTESPFVVRLKAPDEGRIEFSDDVQGDVGVEARAIDDLVLLRSDGTPTYMLAVVVDDHDMGVTQVIRGDDHLANTYRQLPIYQALGWAHPQFAHVPLIHGIDGKKLSKRHGALGVEAYREMGYLPEGLRNYLVRLGWSHGDDEIFTDAQARDWFNLNGLGKAPARLDLQKLSHINNGHMKLADGDRLMDMIKSCDKISGESDEAIKRVRLAIDNLKERASTIPELIEQVEFLLDLRPIEITGKLRKKFDQASVDRLSRLAVKLDHQESWTSEALAKLLSEFCSEEEIGMGKIGPILRASITGGAPSPDLGLVLFWLGKTETLARIQDQISKADFA